MSEALLTPSQCVKRLPLVISEREMRKLLRQSSLAIEHRKQLLLQEAQWEAFLEWWQDKCSSSKSERPRRKRASRKSGEIGATIEEVCPRQIGGPTHIGNQVLACAACNSEAGNKNVAEKVLLREMKRQKDIRTSEAA